jgi:hypothetical protein
MSQRLEDAAGKEAVQRLFRDLQSPKYRLTWGSGQTPSLNVRLPGITDKSVVTLRSEGDLVLNYSSLLSTPGELALSEKLVTAFDKQLGVPRPQNFPNCQTCIKNATWARRVEEVIGILEAVVDGPAVQLRTGS